MMKLSPVSPRPSPKSIVSLVGAKDELAFWRKFVHTDQFMTWLAPYPTPELDPNVISMIKHVGGKVLDVGSGVVSILHGTVPMCDMWAVDPLARQYCEIFDYSAHNVVVPQAVAAEDLLFRDMFDVVHARNSLDHCQRPSDAFAKMVRALRKDGVLIIAGFEREGSFLKGLGMHQWDLFLSGGGRLSLAPAHAPMNHDYLELPKIKPFCGSTTVLPGSGRRWFTWMGRKVEE